MRAVHETETKETRRRKKTRTHLLAHTGLTVGALTAQQTDIISIRQISGVKYVEYLPNYAINIYIT